MEASQTLNFIKNVISNKPSDWLNLTTHRLDIYNENQAKIEFISAFEKLYQQNSTNTKALSELPTAYDYIRLGHPLTSILEWTIANLNGLDSEQVISFQSNTTPILSILRANLLQNKNTQILYTKLPKHFNEALIKAVYGYHFELKQITSSEDITDFNGSTILIESTTNLCDFNLKVSADFYINMHAHLGSILIVNGEDNKSYISEIQHVRRRETIAMTPANTLSVLQQLTENKTAVKLNTEEQKKLVLSLIKNITNTSTKPLVASSGLSIQYAIMMGLIHHGNTQHKGKELKIVVPPNCYGGTNDQARRIAACLDHVSIVDLPVDGDNDMVKSIDTVLTQIANQDAVAYIIAEIPTNPRVEVPNLKSLEATLSKQRHTNSGKVATAPIFILDQTFCPNVHFLGDEDILASIEAISYASGSKFPSGGKCTAGYCVSNTKGRDLMTFIETQLNLCDNEATTHQYEYLSEQLPSMNSRIANAYTNTLEFVNYIKEILPEAKINFVSDDLATLGFTPSVFSLDLPTKGQTDQERETYKRALNLKLINLMITKIPNESKYCVSYGQLKGCYWTIPATSTQGTTKEGDKDYIVRASLSHNIDLQKHKDVFLEFVNGI